MAEGRMLFDLRGRRKNVVKIVYAVLALLMGTSLFFVIGPFNVGELVNGGGSSGNAAEPFEEQAERIEVKLKKNPDDPDLLMGLTRAQLSVGNAEVTVEANGSRAYTPESVQAYQEASDSWSKYLKAAGEPAANLAQLMAPTLISLAELSRTYPETQRNLEAAAEAQAIVAKQRPTLNSYSTLAFYTYFTGDFAAAEKAEAEAKRFAKGKAEKEAVASQLKQVSERARKFQNERKKAEQAAKAEKEAPGGEAGAEGLESPLEGLGGGLGG